MTINEAYVIYFSPTHTSKQVAEAIVRGTGIKKVTPIDITRQAAADLVIPATALTLIAVPVYGGHVAPLAMSRLQSIKGTDSPTVLTVVYGNRAYEKALMELDAWAVKQGLKVIAGATFIGEHSYSNESYPIAAGRPDSHDLDLAQTFGAQIQEKIEKATQADHLYAVDVRAIQRPNNLSSPCSASWERWSSYGKAALPCPVPLG